MTLEQTMHTLESHKAKILRLQAEIRKLTYENNQLTQKNAYLLKIYDESKNPNDQ